LSDGSFHNNETVYILRERVGSSYKNKTGYLLRDNWWFLLE